MTAAGGGAPTRSARMLLALAAVAVAFAAADTYVVVLALPDMMAGVGLSIEELQRAAPLISGFLLGYVAMLPLIGRIADLRGRLPVLGAGLVVFAGGSLLTALAYDLSSMVAGRFLQGLGGGALVPATLALVADLYPVERRGVPLGLVSAVQELGSVLGPLGGAVILALADWRGIFLVNLAVGLLLAAAIRRLGGLGVRAPSPPRRVPDLLGLLLLVVMLAAYTIAAVEPTGMMRDLTWGRLFIPVAGSGRWLTPLGLTTIGAAVLLLLRCLTARRPLVDLRGWAASARDVDLIGAFLLAVALGGVILAFATADPQVQVFSTQGVWYLVAAAIAALALIIHLRRTADPLLPRGALRRTPAWGSVVVSFFVGAALVAALIDIPLFARTTVYGDSQLKAALVLLRFLVALPIGAVIGGYLTRRVPAGLVAGAGMLLAAVGFGLMTQWDADTLHHLSATLPLVVGGLGFGLALAPVNAAVLATTDSAVHGLTSSLVVVARMVGMLVGISGLTTLGLRRYYSEQGDLPSIAQVCGSGHGLCDRYEHLLRAAGIAQEHTVFAGAAVAALAGGVLAVVLFRGAPTRAVGTREALAGLG